MKCLQTVSNITARVLRLSRTHPITQRASMGGRHYVTTQRAVQDFTQAALLDSTQRALLDSSSPLY